MEVPLSFQIVKTLVFHCSYLLRCIKLTKLPKEKKVKTKPSNITYNNHSSNNPNYIHYCWYENQKQIYVQASLCNPLHN